MSFVQKPCCVYPKPKRGEITHMLTLIALFCNRYRYVPDVVESIIKQDYPNLKIVFIDNGSTDATKSYLESVSAPPFSSKSKHTLYQYKSNIGKPKALDIAIRETTTPYVLTVDGDIMFSNSDDVSCLSKAYQCFSKIHPSFSLLSPRYNLVLGGALPPDDHIFDTTLPMSIGPFTFMVAQTVNVAGGCQLFKKADYEKVGGYSVEGQLYDYEDASFFIKLREKKLLSAYVNEVRVTHLGDNDAVYFPEWQKIKTQAHSSGSLRGRIYKDYSDLLI